MKFSKELELIDCLNYFCIEYFESNGITPCQTLLDEVEGRLLSVCQFYLMQHNKKLNIVIPG
jgi:hypothetical protein